jgi:hypothetical protein
MPDNNPPPSRPIIINGSAFPLGRVVITSGIAALVEEAGFDCAHFLNRHARKDWGDLDAEDLRANAVALEQGHRLFSAYDTPHGKVYVITEWDRSVTTLLLSVEY